MQPSKDAEPRGESAEVDTSHLALAAVGATLAPPSNTATRTVAAPEFSLADVGSRLLDGVPPLAEPSPVTAPAFDLLAPGSPLGAKPAQASATPVPLDTADTADTADAEDAEDVAFELAEPGAVLGVSRAAPAPEFPDVTHLKLEAAPDDDA